MHAVLDQTRRDPCRASSEISDAEPARAVRPRRSRVHRPVAAGLAVAALLVGASVAAAGGWVTTFETRHVAPLALGPSDLVGLPDLDAYGQVDVQGDPAVHAVADAATASAQTGLDVADVTSLPRGVDEAASYYVAGRVTATFTLSAQEGSAQEGPVEEGAAAPPSARDGSQVRLVAGPGVATVWPSGSGAPALMVARAVAPTASATGASLDEIRDHLLSIPGLSDDVAARLRAITADGSTLPLPVQSDRFTTSTADVGGTPASVITTRDRTFAAVVWVDAGIVNVVAGSLDAAEVVTLANELR